MTGYLQGRDCGDETKEMANDRTGWVDMDEPVVDEPKQPTLAHVTRRVSWDMSTMLNQHDRARVAL